MGVREGKSRHQQGKGQKTWASSLRTPGGRKKNCRLKAHLFSFLFWLFFSLVFLSPSPALSSQSLSSLQTPRPGVSLSPSPAPPACLPGPCPQLCKGPENTHRELCCQTTSIRRRDRPAQLFPIPSALAGLRRRAGSPHAPPFWEVGVANTGPRALRQLNGWPGISQHRMGPQQGTSWPPHCRAKVTKAGLERGTDPHSAPCSCLLMAVFSLTHDPCALSGCVHTHRHAPSRDTASAHLEETSSIPAGTSGERAGALERGGQRAEASKAPLASYSLETVTLQDKLLPSCPGRRPRRWVRAQGAKPQIKVLHALGRQCPFTKCHCRKSHSAQKRWRCPQPEAP